MEVLCDLQVLVPRGRRLHSGRLKQVFPIVHHVKVAVQWDGIGATTERRAEVPEEGANLIPGDVRVVCDHVVDRHQEARLDEVDQPLRRKDNSIDAIGPGREVGQDLGVEVREWYRDDIHVGTRHRLEIRSPPLQRLGNDGSRKRENIDCHAAVTLRQSLT